MGKFNTKFNVGMVKELGKQDEKPSEELSDNAVEQKIKVGAGFLQKENPGEDYIYLKRSEIEKNENNKYSINGIQSLAWSIGVFGVLQPLQVKRSADGGYILLGGERRITAIDILIQDPKMEQWTKDTLIPCIIKDPEEIDLPLDSELKESLAIMSPNKEARKYTDSDRLMEIREWKKIIDALRQAGVENLPGADEEGKEQEISIKGEKTRDILVKTTGLSRGTINKFEKVEKQGSEAVKEALLNNAISISTAERMVDELKPEEQEELLQEARQEGIAITPKEIEKKSKNAVKESDPGRITEKNFRDDIKGILKRLKKEEVQLDEADLMAYYNYIREIEKLLFKDLTEQADENEIKKL